MQTDPVVPSESIIFPITYEIEGSRAQNPDFKGSGNLAISPEGPVYVFSGKRRALLSGQTIEREFKSDEIWNVTVAGRMVSFHSRRRIASEQNGPFVFYLANAEKAQSAASLLPAAVDGDFVAVRDFSTRLYSLKGASSSWTSVTNIIIALNVLVFVIMGSLGAGWFRVESMMPYVLYGANQGAATSDGEWWRLLTSMFMHYGLLHLSLNMWALYQAGHFVERLQGRCLYALTYLAAGLAGGFASIAWHSNPTWSAGASGAVFGVYGAIFGYLLKEKQGLPPSIYQSLLKSSLTFAGYNILFGAAYSGTDNAAHIGGVLGGLVFGWLVAMPVDQKVRDQQTGRRLQFGIVALLGLIVAGVSLTPRFDYSVREELAWDTANQPFADQESVLQKQNQAGLASLKPGEDATAHSEWITNHLVSFYRSWNEKLTQLTLNPERQTSKRRAALQKILQLQIESYTQLALGLRSNISDAIARYNVSEREILRQISEFNKQ
jgi:rhomboid protease GluP